MLTPHMEVLDKELAYTEKLMKKDFHLSTHDDLVDLVAQLDIQYQSLEATINN